MYSGCISHREVDPNVASNAWITTHSGKQFYYVRPYWDHAAIDINDMAVALSREPRYNGHTQKMYCPTPEQRILTDDLKWVLAGDLRVGDGLIGFDEHPVDLGSAGKMRRRFRPSTVLANIPVKRPIVRLVMSNGSSVRSSAEHPWLIATKRSRNQVWRTAGEICEAVRDGRKRYMHQFSQPWTNLACRDSGWLAGFYDGEGSFSSANRKGVQLTVAQNPGLALDEAARIISSIGFEVSARKSKQSGCIALQLRGGWREVMRLLWSVRPVRLLDNFVRSWRNGDMAKQMDGVGPPIEIISVYDEGEEWVSGIETSTRTYICEGFAAHNSVAQHSVIVTEMLAGAGCGIQTQLIGLLHDGPEFVMKDLPSPLKRLLPGYKDLETGVWNRISHKFLGEVVEIPEIVHQCDDAVFSAEIVDLFPFAPLCNDMPRLRERWADKVIPWTEEESRRTFLDVFYDIMHDTRFSRIQS